MSTAQHTLKEAIVQFAGRDRDGNPLAPREVVEAIVFTPDGRQMLAEHIMGSYS